MTGSKFYMKQRLNPFQILNPLNQPPEVVNDGLIDNDSVPAFDNVVKGHVVIVKAQDILDFSKF